MKKVCHITSVHKWNDVRIFLKECSSLAKAGFDTTLIATNCLSQRVNGVNIIGISTNTTSETNRLARIFKTTNKVYLKALEVDADIYHIHDPELLPYALKLKRKGKKVIYDVHEDVPQQIKDKYWIPYLLRSFISATFMLYETYATKNLSFIITATPYIKEQFKSITNNCMDINNYPLLEELSSSENTGTIKANEICYIGGISKIRGINILMDVLNKMQDIKLNLAGEYSPAEYRNEVSEKPAWKMVKEYGFVNRTETYNIMAKSKAGIVTFLPLPNHVNAQPNKMFEYMSAGIPVIASDFPLWKEIVEGNNCGICVNPNDADAIANAINSLVNDNSKAETMGNNGRKAVIEKYNWSIEEKKLIDIYNKL